MAQTARRSNRMIGTLVVAVFSTMMSRVIFSPLMPMLRHHLGFSLTLAGSVFLILNVSYGATLLASGFLSSRIGHGRTIVACLLLIAAGLVGAAAAPAFWVLAISIAVVGAGAGLYPASGLVMINGRVTPERREAAFAFHEVGPNLAFLVAPVAVIALEPHVGWRWVLVIVAALVGVSALVFSRWGVSDGGYGTAPKPATIVEVLRLPETWVAVAALSAALAAVQGVYGILPAYLVDVRGMTADRVNLLVSISRIGAVVLLLAANRIISLLGRRRTITGVLIVTAALTSLLGLVEGLALAALVIAQPALLGVFFPAILALIGTIGREESRNVTYSIVLTLAVAIGAGVAPTILGLFGDLGLGWVGFAGLGVYIVAAVVLFRAVPHFGGNVPERTARP